MITVKEYRMAESLEEAYQLNQKRNNRIIGGMLWTKMSRANVNVAIELSRLGLDAIEETEGEFKIGCMVTLRQLEEHTGFLNYTSGAVKDALSHIVGVQFRNLATIGGSVFGRYGFSDVITLLLALETSVELYKGGIIPLKDFLEMPYDNDVLVSVIVKKENISVVYESVRITKTDFPVLAMAAVKGENGVRVTVGARPAKATLLCDSENILDGGINENSAKKFAAYVKANVKTGSNMRGSAEYRSHLAAVLAERAVLRLRGDDK